MPESEPKYCKDCKWFEGDSYMRNCASPLVYRTDPVYGRQKYPAREARQRGVIVNGCGVVAERFEPLEERPSMHMQKWWPMYVVLALIGMTGAGRWLF